MVKKRSIFGRLFGSDVKNERVYNGETYYLFMATKTKREAILEAKRLRKNGYSVRIHIYSDTFGVYSSPKPPKWYSGFYLKPRKR